MPESKDIEPITDFERQLVTEHYEWKVKCCDNFLYQTDEQYREQMDYYTKMCDPEYRRKEKREFRRKIFQEQREERLKLSVFVAAVLIISILALSVSIFTTMVNVGILKL